MSASLQKPPEDWQILVKQLGVEESRAKELLIQADQDIVEAMLIHEGNPTAPKDNTTPDQFEQFRKILDKKDALFEINKHKLKK